MESGITNVCKPAVAETEKVVNTESVDSFQSFIYELFEKNGILNDLRAYLRGQIVNVLKNAQTGDPPLCQKNFTQRLDLTFQALNMLITEYLLRLEFSYSFSVFVSEIPLANMVFGFAKTLMEKIDGNKTDMRFKDADVWSILNYLGVQCDSEHASNIVQMYNNEKQHPLLLCILKSIPMYKEVAEPPQSVSENSVASSKSLDSAEVEATHQKDLSVLPECSHCNYCKKCQNKIYKLKDKYKKKKRYLAKNIKFKESTNVIPVKSESLVKNISNMEKGLIGEMFQQLKSVYETEVEMVKVQEEKKVRRSIATHAMQLQQKQNQLEETFKAREVEMERSVQHKKKFLWGLARSLRDQHQHMTRAMLDVRAETERLELKEDSLKTQLAEAEQILKKRGQEMQLQITNELTILEGHLESMKKERENITRQRSELEEMKTIQETSKVNKAYNIENEEVHSHYDLLQNELAILKTYLKSSQMQAKCVIERGTITEACELVSQINVTLNNSQGNEKYSNSDDFDERVKMNQVVNDFRKKNVNFSQSNFDEIYHERSRDCSRSSNSSEAGDTATPDLHLERGRDRDLIQRLRDENIRLKAFARQRRSRASTAPRPRTTPPARAQLHAFPLNTSVSASTLNVGWRKGAGEELSIFSNAQPRILVPGDTLPFIGVLRDRHGNNRRPASIRARTLGGVSKRAASPFRERFALGAGTSAQGVRGHVAVASCSLQHESYQAMRDRLQQRPRPALNLENRHKDKSPKSLLADAKDKLRRKDSYKACIQSPRDKSPTTVLHEAKLRLRKLEIEAEAVEKSYLDFRRRHSKRDDPTRALDVTRSHSTQELDATTKNDIETQFADLQKSMRGDFDKYIRDYKNKFDIGETHFRNKPTVAERVKPIPDTFIADCTDHVDAHGNYLETPLTEFRKLYTCAQHTRLDDTGLQSPTRSKRFDSKHEFDFENSARNDTLRQVKHNKQAELQILKQNINKMYHLSNNNFDSAATSAEDENKLRVAVENISEINYIKSQKQDLLLVVQSSVNSREVTMSGLEEPSELFSAQTTIIVSPKRPGSESLEDGGLCGSTERPRRSLSLEQAAHLTRNDVLDAIFHADPNNEVSSVQMQLDMSKDEEDSFSEYDKADYPGVFVVDVENYNSRSEDDNSPISVAGMAEDDNFWEA